MTPKEKARFLIDRFNHFDNDYYNESFKDTDLGKQCAIIAVDEIMKIGWNLPHYDNKEGYNYWYLVKTEIEKL